MTTTQPDSEREEFEAWAVEHGFSIRMNFLSPSADYYESDTRRCWRAWRGSWKAGRAPLLQRIAELEAERDAKQWYPFQGLGNPEYDAPQSQSSAGKDAEQPWYSHCIDLDEEAVERLRDYIGDKDNERPISVVIGNGGFEPGLYVGDTEYLDEGVVFIAAMSQGAQDK